MANKLGITELVLRDAHQSLLATRMRIDDMLPIAEKLDNMGFWSLETWGGATFDACIRYLGEDPWQRLRTLKRVRATVFGHVHQEYDDDYEGIRILATPSTCRQFKPGSDKFAVDDKPPAYRHITLGADGSVETELIWVNP